MIAILIAIIILLAVVLKGNRNLLAENRRKETTIRILRRKIRNQ